MTSSLPCTAVILAAGKGTRMCSETPKVLHTVCGKPMLLCALEAADKVADHVVVVLGHKRDEVAAVLPPTALQAVQDPPQGTGDALRVTSNQVPHRGVVLVLPGDAPLIQSSTLLRLKEGHGEALCSVLTAHIPEADAPTSGYGRIVRDAEGNTQAIVEAALASPAQRELTEVNTGIYAFDAKWLYTEVLPQLQPQPPKGEYYLTDAIAIAAKAGRLQAIKHGDLTEVTGVNDLAALSELETEARRRINQAWMDRGVRFLDPSTTYIDLDVSLSADVIIEPGVVLRGDTRIASGVRIGAGTHLTNCTVATNAVIHPYTVAQQAKVGANCSVGPFARLREETLLEDGSKVGNFVETKKTRLGAGAKANHLSYLGDSEVGAEANIGAGTITCNYDGAQKHRTTIGEGAFIGSNTALVAPIEIGEGAVVGAGSTLCNSVPAQALGLARAKESVIEGAGAKIRARNKAAKESKK